MNFLRFLINHDFMGLVDVLNYWIYVLKWIIWHFWCIRSDFERFHDLQIAKSHFFVVQQVVDGRQLGDAQGAMPFEALTGSLPWLTIACVDAEHHSGDVLVLDVDDGRHTCDA